MSYIAEIQGNVSSSQPVAIARELPEDPSAIELFSYALCCATQGLLWVAYMGLIAFVPIALSRGMISIG